MSEIQAMKNDTQAMKKDVLANERFLKQAHAYLSGDTKINSMRVRIWLDRFEEEVDKQAYERGIEDGYAKAKAERL